MDLQPIETWLPHTYPLIISGPCSAESEEQVMNTALQLIKIPQVKIFRAGVWKPRTRPNQFEGHGEEALLWLKKVKEKTGLLIAVEVARPEHIEAVLRHGIDMIWIGARTVVNPFSVQELAESLVGLDIPVMIKNPVTPDTNLWIGAIERIQTVGIKKIIAIHRGFTTFEKTPYRNNPLWEIPIELQRRIPNLPIICDPSHICGNRNLYNTAQQAMDLAMQGLMIETHPHPDQALTDASQQLTPQQLQQLINSIKPRELHGNTTFNNQLIEQRSKIDSIDQQVLELLARRMELVNQIGLIKKEHNITVFQIERWKSLFEHRLNYGKKINLSESFIQKLLRLIHEESITVQEKIMNRQQ